MVLGVFLDGVQTLARTRMPMLECSIGLGSDQHICSLGEGGLWTPLQTSNWHRLILCGSPSSQRCGQLTSLQIVDAHASISIAGGQKLVVQGKLAAMNELFRITKGGLEDQGIIHVLWLHHSWLSHSSALLSTLHVTIQVVDRVFCIGLYFVLREIMHLLS